MPKNDKESQKVLTVLLHVNLFLNSEEIQKPKALAWYGVFHRFRKAELIYGDSILSSSQFFLLPQPPLKTKKSDENWLENNHLATLI